MDDNNDKLSDVELASDDQAAWQNVEKGSIESHVYTDLEVGSETQIDGFASDYEYSDGDVNSDSRSGDETYSCGLVGRERKELLMILNVIISPLNYL